jgi:putative peptide modification system cyclase
MNEMTHRPSIEAPQLRTLLLTDLCDSTTLVERIGDVEAATLFRDHDRLVLDLQQRWRGRLIDRSDGLLLLFERPIDGLGFALDYVRELREMGDARRLDLRARAGLHVGEVLTWRNSDEAVSVGAKPLEVEGLAKPMAARLMAMARPGQILLSAIAEPLAHRAARELGERGQHLLWKSHGRWRFKGVPDGQQIYEVGEPGIAPLRAPPNTPKAWRDIPLWRRPAALAAEAAIIAGIGVGVWFATRPAPAIAFNQRDWVVVADLRNLTGQSVLDDSLEQAFRISLEQSRYVNVLSDLKARDTLARMQLKPDTMLDRAIASEIALRDGARAVILPTVAEVGGKVRVSAEIIDPHTQTTLYAQSADGAGVGSALTSIDDVTASLREKLGETLESIESDSAPLPDVTTKNLEALRAYALAQKAYARYQNEEALQLFRRATELDPQFALAWIGQMRILYGREDARAAMEPLRKAQDRRDHLPTRERLYLDAWVSEFDDPPATIGKWLELSRLYPDYPAARNNAAIWLYKENRFKEALEHAKASAIPQNPLAGQSYDTVGRAQLGLNDYVAAEVAFNRSYKASTGSLRRLVSTAAARRDFAGAQKLAATLDTRNAFNYIERTSLAVDVNELKAAATLARTGLTLTGSESKLAGRYMLLPVATVEMLQGDVASARRIANEAADKALVAVKGVGSADVEEDAALALSSTLVAQRSGDKDLARKVLAELAKQPKLMRMPQLAELAAVVRAQEARLAGRPDEAIALLQPFRNGRERYQTRVVLMDAYLDQNDRDHALEQARWLDKNRGLAYIELECGHCLQALNVADSNRAYKTLSELKRVSSSDQQPQTPLSG